MGTGWYHSSLSMIAAEPIPDRLDRFSFQLAAAVDFLETRRAAQKSLEFLISHGYLPDPDQATSLHGFDFVTTVRLRNASFRHCLSSSLKRYGTPGVGIVLH